MWKNTNGGQTSDYSRSDSSGDVNIRKTEEYVVANRARIGGCTGIRWRVQGPLSDLLT